MARIDRRLAEAEAALLTLEEAVRVAPHSEIERDSAILRLIYTFEAIWKSCQVLLAEREDIEVGSANTAIRAARRLGWLSDDEAEAAKNIGKDRNLAVHITAGRSARKSNSDWQTMPRCCGDGSTHYANGPMNPAEICNNSVKRSR